MKLKILLTLLIVLALAAVANAQTKISGTLLCGKPDTFYTIQVGDSPNHTFGIDQSKCNWSKPLMLIRLFQQTPMYWGQFWLAGSDEVRRLRISL